MVWKRRRSEQDFGEELQSHLALETDRLVQEGMNPEEARFAAARRFGSVVKAQERFYEARRALWLDRLLQDVRISARSLAHYPLACAVAIASLGVGIGSATITLTFRNTLFHKAPPLYVEPERLSRVDLDTPDRRRGQVPAALYERWALDGEHGGRVAAAAQQRPADIRLPDRVETVPIRAVAPNLFSLLGVTPVLGRAFEAEPVGQPGGRDDEPAPAVLSYRVWQQFFGARPDVVGTIIWIDRVPHTIVGVMPERFWFSAMNSPVWTVLDPRMLPPDSPLDVVARRDANLTGVALQDRLQGSASDFINRLPVEQRRARVHVRDVGGTPLGDNIGTVPLFLLGTSVLFTLLIACTNVAILLIAQWTAREHEIAIRASLGANRRRLVRTLITESILISLCGGVLGLCATFALRGLIVRKVPDVTFFDLAVDPILFLQSAGIALFAGVLTGLGPALYETRRLQVNPLRQIRASDRVRQRWRHALVAFEIAVTVALLVVTGALVSAYRRTLTTDLGFPTASLASARVENAQGVPIARMLHRLKELPGVASAAAATAVPMRVSGPQRPVGTEATSAGRVMAERVHVGPGYFATLGVPVRTGRDLTEREVSAGTRVGIVNQVLADQLWPGRTVTGELLWVDQAPYEVIGVVAAYANSTLSRPRPAFFLPIAAQESDTTTMQFLVRTTDAPATMLQTIRRELRSLSSQNVVTAVATLDAVIEVGAQEIMVGTYPMVPLVTTAILLTAAGIYGVLAFAVTRRSSELALRMAIGASDRDVLRLVAAHSLRLIAIGLALGVGSTYALTRISQGAGGVFDSPGWQAFAIPTAAIIVIGGVATWIPSRRAMRIDPAALLRST